MGLYYASCATAPKCNNRSGAKPIYLKPVLSAAATNGTTAAVSESSRETTAGGEVRSAVKGSRTFSSPRALSTL